ncbi:DNA alkylation repair protein [Jeotgalibacillus soli]|uniref:DNA alkylation repair protein n=1 Tax=Jeotgalibacillus soli TaxID=889306 RepID=A0A0C2RHF2_9BACL|nr:DNA alkylation repair protein [Jeotgalibacillus soli]KIL49590.1 hypothetical protein KP78_10580 [Jeotgalibacillus soli]
MASPLKELFNEHMLRGFSEAVQKEYPVFQTEAFIAQVLNDEWEQKELKERMRHVTITLRPFLPSKYNEMIDLLCKITPHFSGLAYLFLPDIVEVFGLDEDWDVSMEAFACLTHACSAEFAVRPFIERDPERMMKQMHQWTMHESEHVRRLASEGCRPRLPWGQALKSFQKEASSILPILEALKEDPSLYVRRSVANNLNDISKDHPAVVKEIAAKWYGRHEETDWIIRHAVRGLLRKADPEILALFGYYGEASVDVTLSLDRSQLRIGENLTFQFTISRQALNGKLRIEFAVDYVKANGKTSKKLFKITDTFLKEGTRTFERKLSFRNLTTRVHYPGEHRLSIVINGVEKASALFMLTSE